MRISQFISTSVLALILLSCGDERGYKTIGCEDSHISVERYDSVLTSHEDALPLRLGDLKRHHGDFAGKYFRAVIRIGSQNNDSLMAVNLANWLHDPLIATLNDSISVAYSDISDIRNDLAFAFCRYRQHISNRIPGIVTYVSGCGYQMAVTDSVLGIGLDMYLDNSARIYYSLGLPQYRVRRMKRAYVVSDALKAWISSEMDHNTDENDLLSAMIHEGMILYALDVVLPDVEDTIKIGYTGKDLDWCRLHEEDIWAHLMAKQLLYTTDMHTIDNYTGEGPFTKDFGPGSPPRIGAWIGWRIVGSYMNNHRDITPAALLHNKDATQLLNSSAYRPGS